MASLGSRGTQHEPNAGDQNSFAIQEKRIS